MISSALGIFFHALGGFASGSFYLPLKKITQWSWESGWLVNGFFAWIIMPWFVAVLTIPDLLEILIQAEVNTIFWTYFFGILWGIGGLTFGLTMRYLGIGLGMAMALGLTAAFGTLIPPIYDGSFIDITQSTNGQIVLFGVLVSFIGIFLCGKAGVLKEQHLSEDQKKEGIKEFDLKKGLIVAFFAGIMSSCFAFGIQAGAPLAASASIAGTNELWVNGPIFIVILLGGATTNFAWSILLNIKKKSWKDYKDTSSPLKMNYLFAALAGITWYLQFMFYGMGTTQMGEHDFASWSIHMAFIIAFSSMWGLITGEWKGVKRKVLVVLGLGIFILILSTLIIGMAEQIATSV
ncbi:L-rhamnose/proton symporter RhaT [Ekhidna sp.]